mmetsp:Transcript_27651/g.73450  ORF Transcript_27651/g.73450 Transcript_27651/m.73450 type:complete len:245 (+) Transcript_27651:1328-2062(+)
MLSRRFGSPLLPTLPSEFLLLPASEFRLLCAWPPPAGSVSALCRPSPFCTSSTEDDFLSDCGGAPATSGAAVWRAEGEDALRVLFAPPPPPPLAAEAAGGNSESGCRRMIVGAASPWLALLPALGPWLAAATTSPLSPPLTTATSVSGTEASVWPDLNLLDPLLDTARDGEAEVTSEKAPYSEPSPKLDRSSGIGGSGAGASCTDSNWTAELAMALPSSPPSSSSSSSSTYGSYGLFSLARGLK